MTFSQSSLIQDGAKTEKHDRDTHTVPPKFCRRANPTVHAIPDIVTIRLDRIVITSGMACTAGLARQQGLRGMQAFVMSFPLRVCPVLHESGVSEEGHDISQTGGSRHSESLITPHWPIPTSGGSADRYRAPPTPRKSLPGLSLPASLRTSPLDLIGSISICRPNIICSAASDLVHRPRPYPVYRAVAIKTVGAAPASTSRKQICS